jgi:NADH dehydrogenase
MGERIAVTGANGFVGRHVTSAASAAGREVVGVVRSDEATLVVRDCGGRPVQVRGLDVEELTAAFAGAQAVVHLAQIGAERGAATYADVNVEGTRRVIRAAHGAGTSRLVFLSGLGVAHYGMRRRTTNRYFLSKWAAETELFGSGLGVVVFRPSYVLGPGGELVPELLKELAQGEVERIGDGGYRMQPIDVRDAAALILAATDASSSRPAVFDLVGPETVSYSDFVERVAEVAREHKQPAEYRFHEISETEADRQAEAGGYRGMLPDELDCLLCDEVSEHSRLEALLGRPLMPLDKALRSAVRGALA